MAEKEKSRIEGLNDRLNSRTRYQSPLDKRAPVRELDTTNVEEKWQTPELDDILKQERIPTKINPFMKKVFILALLFFIATIAVAVFVFRGGGTFISSKNVDISILGPTVISAGEVLELGLSISNTNNADLEFANLSIQYPSGARNPDNTAETITYTKDSLGVIKAGAETIRSVRAVLLGLSGEAKEIKFSVEYKVKGSDATFYKDKIFEIVIGDSPVTLVVGSPSSAISGESFTTTVRVKSRTTDILKNIVLKAEYPYGYSITGATPSALADNNIWALGDLAPGEEKTVSIQGNLIGEDKEERTLRFYVGVSDTDTTSSNLRIVITSMLHTVSINRQSIGLNILFNGESVSTYVAPAARSVSTSIRFQNNFPDKLLNPRLEVSLSGRALDSLSVVAGESGLYDPSNSKVVWNLRNLFGNQELAPGEGGQVSLRFSSIPTEALSEGNNDIKLVFSITGTPVGGVGQQPVTASETRTVRISSQVNFASKVLRSLGSFANYGPIPPKVDEETTYTVVFAVGNTQGDLSDAKVVAQLGQNVSWLGTSDFTSDGLSYASSSNTVTWNLGTVLSDTGFSSATREVSFQISLTPFMGQVGTTPSLVTGIVFSGKDTRSGNIVTVSNPPLSTRLTADPAFIQGDDVVIK